MLRCQPLDLVNGRITAEYLHGPSYNQYRLDLAYLSCLVVVAAQRATEGCDVMGCSGSHAAALPVED